MQGIVPSRKMALLTISILSALFMKAYADNGTEIHFDPAFLHLGKGETPDISRFTYGASLSPGVHRVRIMFNEQLAVSQDVMFVNAENQQTIPCITSSLLKQLPLRHEKLPEQALSSAEDICIDFLSTIPGSTISTDSNSQTVNIDVPQVYENRTARDSVPPSMWDSGITAALLGYNFNAYNSESYGHSYTNLYTSLNAGINIGSWFIRHNGVWSKSNLTGSQYQAQNSYLQRDIPSLTGRISVGQVNTSGQLFDTLPFTGMKVESDERMEPLSRRGYAPEVRGTARTNARVTVKQNDTVIYETTVSPGEFIINDLYPTGFGGDLDVTVHEADGTEQHFQVPFASVAQLLRPGQSRYELSVGELHYSGLRHDPSLWQGTWRQGLTNWLTVYSGVQGSEKYRSGQGGVGVATPLGAISADVTHARTELGKTAKGDETRKGESYRLSYNKNLVDTRTNFALAAYRFSTHGYMDYLSAVQSIDAISKGYDSETILRNKSRYTLTASQGLPEGWGQFYLSSSLQNYWNAGGTDKQYQFGYSNNVSRMTYGVNAGRSRSSYGKVQDFVSLNLSIPLGTGRNAPIGRASYDHVSHGAHSLRTGITGTAGAEQRLSYGLSGTTASQGNGSSAAANAQYRSSAAIFNASASKGRDYQSLSGGMSGTIIGHAEGLTVSPYQGTTFALVEAKGAEGAKVGGYSGVQIDSRGFAAVPYLNPYQMNDVRIDPKGSSSTVEMENTSQKVAPLDGAVVRIRYQTKQGYPVLINVSGANNSFSFGAEVYDETGNVAGYLGQGSQIYARVEKLSGVLTLVQSDLSCNLPYTIKNNKERDEIEILNIPCQPQ